MFFESQTASEEKKCLRSNREHSFNRSGHLRFCIHLGFLTGNGKRDTMNGHLSILLYLAIIIVISIPETQKHTWDWSLFTDWDTCRFFFLKIFRDPYHEFSSALVFTNVEDLLWVCVKVEFHVTMLAHHLISLSEIIMKDTHSLSYFFSLEYFRLSVLEWVLNEDYKIH